MDKLKIALLCNNKMAAPAMEQLVRVGALCGIATADRDKEVVHLYKKRAAELGVPYRSVSYREYVAGLQEWLQATGADVVFVMTFPWRLPQALLAAPPLGFLNFHYGLLPQMRGADPVFETIRQRLDKAGVTVHIMDEGLDTGSIVLREEVPVNPEMTYGMLSAQLAYMGAQMCAKLTAPFPSPFLERLEYPAELEVQATAMQSSPAINLSTRTDEQGARWKAAPQDESQARYWPKIGAEAFTIHWDSMDSPAIKAMVKSCNPIAKGVPVVINGWKIGICEVGDVNLQGDTGNIKPGTIVALDVQNGLIVYCNDGRGLRLEVVYTEEGYLPGYKLAMFGIGIGMIFS